jgi:hypothetical protein
MKAFSVAEVVRLTTAVPQDSEFLRILRLKCLTELGVGAGVPGSACFPDAHKKGSQTHLVLEFPAISCHDAGRSEICESRNWSPGKGGYRTMEWGKLIRALALPCRKFQQKGERRTRYGEGRSNSG